MATIGKVELAKYIDHTLLKPSAVESDILNITEEGKRFDVAAVCINPYWVSAVKNILAGSSVECCAVAGFPLGISKPAVIANEARQAIDDGADEIDMVINLGLACDKKWKELRNSVETVKTALGEKTLKVILEICELDDTQIVDASNAAIHGGADYIKTSTGFGRHGATISAVKLMSEVALREGSSLGKSIGVKAAGGIRSLDDTLEMIKNGATRIGTSSSNAILVEAERRIKNGENLQL